MTAPAPGMARRIAENEARFRNANERIEVAFDHLEPESWTMPVVCECGRRDCFQMLRLTREEYERVRQHPRHFVCSPGHQITGEGLGRIVEEDGRFVISEKLGLAGAVAEDLDPRHVDERDTA